MTWDNLLSYLNSFSSLHTFRERYPEDANNPEGDIATRFWKRLQAEMGYKGEEGEGEGEVVEVEWPMALIMVRRK